MDEFHHQWHGQLEVLADFEKTAMFLGGKAPSPKVHPVFVQIGLRIRNLADVPITMTFPTTQLFEIELCDEEGQVLTRWSQGRVFADVISERTLDPHRSWYLEGELPLFDENHQWVPSGNYTIRIYMKANMRPGAMAPFRLLVGP